MNKPDTRSARREPGRGEGRSGPPGTAAALVDSGRRLFARHGFDGCSVRAITRDAGVNLGAVTYHFGGKRGLYDSVVASCLEPLVERLARVAAARGDPLDRLAEVVEAYFEHLWSNPDLPFLMMQELAAGRLPPPSGQSALKRMLGAVSGVVLEGQATGVVRSGDPLLLALSVIAQPVHLTVVRRVAGAVAGIDQGDPTVRPRLVEHVKTFVRRGLATDPAAEGGAPSAPETAAAERRAPDPSTRGPAGGAGEAGP